MFYLAYNASPVSYLCHRRTIISRAIKIAERVITVTLLSQFFQSSHYVILPRFYLVSKIAAACANKELLLLSTLSSMLCYLNTVS